MSANPKTIRNWLKTLPEPYRTEAIAEMDKQFGKDRDSRGGVYSLQLAIILAFSWVQSIQGEPYWDSVFKRVEAGEFDCPTPNQTESEYPRFEYASPDIERRVLKSDPNDSLFVLRQHAIGFDNGDEYSLVVCIGGGIRYFPSLLQAGSGCVLDIPEEFREDARSAYVSVLESIEKFEEVRKLIKSKYINTSSIHN